MMPVAILMVFALSGCNNARFKKLDSGLEYKILAGKGGKEIKHGNFLKMTVTQYYNDSLLPSPFDTIPQIVMLDSMRVPAEYVRIFLQAKSGDSVVTRISTDTVAKHNPLPSFAKPHQFFSTRFKIVDVLTNQADAEKANEELRSRMMKADSLAMEKQKVLDEATIKDYLAKNNIKAERTPEGTYVEVTNQGTGPKVEPGKAVSVLYKGMLLGGKIFDESYDSTGAPKDPFTFVVGAPGAIEGWSDGMVYFNEGGSGRLFIPSARAYGSRGAGQDIAPNTPIMFEVTITKVQNQDEYQKEMAARQKKLEEEHQKQLKEQQQKK